MEGIGDEYNPFTKKQRSTEIKRFKSNCTLQSRRKERKKTKSEVRINSQFEDGAKRVLRWLASQRGTLTIGVPRAIEMSAMVRQVKLCPPPSHLVTSQGR